MTADIDRLQFFFIGNVIGLALLVGTVVVTAPQKLKAPRKDVDTQGAASVNASRSEATATSIKSHQTEANSPSKPEDAAPSKSAPTESRADVSTPAGRGALHAPGRMQSAPTHRVIVRPRLKAKANP